MRRVWHFFWGYFRKYWDRIVALMLTLTVAGVWIYGQFEGQVGVSLAIMIMLGLVLARLISLAEPKRSAIEFHRGQSAANEGTVSFINSQMAADEVNLIEYSSKSISEAGGILENLKKKNCFIKLLICHPQHTITSGQKVDFQQEKRICPAIQEHHGYPHLFPSYDRIRIKCYKEPASLRGRKFGNKLIQMGWYTYDLRGDVKSFGRRQIWGHENSLVTAPIPSDEGLIFVEMFDLVFKDLWKRSTPLKVVCSRDCPKSKREECPVYKDKDWLKRVSPEGE